MRRLEVPRELPGRHRPSRRLVHGGRSPSRVPLARAEEGGRFVKLLACDLAAPRDAVGGASDAGLAAVHLAAEAPRASAFISGCAGADAFVLTIGGIRGLGGENEGAAG